MIKKKGENSYSSAMSELMEILKDLENGSIEMDHLSENINRAGELLQICREKLRSTESELKIWQQKETNSTDED